MAGAVRASVYGTCAFVLPAHVNLREHLHPGPARPVETDVARDLCDLEPDGGFEIVQRKDSSHQSNRALAVLFAQVSQEKWRARSQDARERLAPSFESVITFPIAKPNSPTFRGS